ncbi:MAG: hypothetical protein R3263_12995, partial [Myxococcota bacterium]|nr:hypothetical protein [Myxococcota bacterium]
MSRDGPQQETETAPAGTPDAAAGDVRPDAAATAGDDLARRVEGRTGALRITGLRGASRAVVVAELALSEPTRPVLVLCADAKATDAFVADLRAALGEPPEGEEGRVRPFPHPDTPPYDRFSPQPFVVAQRMDVLHRLATRAETPDEPAPVVVAPWTALALRVPSREAVRARSLRLRRGEEIDRDALIARLVAAGYARQPLVEERGEIAVRGGIVDVFPPQRARPVRIELLGDEVESLRAFDPASQRSEAPLDELVAPPARELLADRELVVARVDALRALAARQGVPRASVDLLVDQLLRGALPPGAEALAPLLQPATESFLDTLPDGALVVVDEPETGRTRLERFDAEAREAWDAAREAGRLASPPDALLVRADAVEAAVEARRPVLLERLAMEASGAARALHTHGHEELTLRLR